MKSASEFSMSPLGIESLCNREGIWVYLRDDMKLRLDFLDASKVSLELLVSDIAKIQGMIQYLDKINTCEMLLLQPFHKIVGTSI